MENCKHKITRLLVASSVIVALLSPISHSVHAAPVAQEQQVVESSLNKDLGAVIREYANEIEPVFSETQVQAKDTSNKLFARLGIKDNAFKRYVSSIKPKENPFARLVAGRLVQARLTPTGEVISVRVFRPLDAQSKEVSYFEVTRAETKAKFEHKNISRDFDVTTVAFSTAIKTSVAAAGKASNIPESVTKQIDTQLKSILDKKSVQPDDVISAVYESRSFEGADLGAGRLLALEYVGKDESRGEVYWFDNDNVRGYFDAEGNNNEPTFIRLPVEARLTSTFNRLRRHPVTGKLRPHWGIDLAAPTGTPIYASGDGVVMTKRYQKRGYGYWLELDHGSGYQSVYAHLSKYAKGIAEGVKVKKGQLIGYVGRTGMVTGAHLHYELKKFGQQVNPLIADLNTGEGIRPEMKEEYLAAVTPYKRQIAMLGSVRLVKNDVPANP